ncbi:hypothetical protein CC1G_10557 [Coprinopsis cinerea okayama7|uniref:SH3 domain-containing protein n=1 Tax=Coprinopsis cinerea (strain Okayama-7 / 130 / ATCC MYA-4618 / FGSC 9003) TaxID=240176 RepID=A8NDX1_COPC7|nr:hypothetical protein CC1G_10557 [Coprinopsis cinerea okayama7\|eukprot:XP_001832881.1 hypothetical protein CC1G_10557 [Coprinopsis cinerea okayama7\
MSKSNDTAMTLDSDPTSNPINSSQTAAGKDSAGGGGSSDDPNTISYAVAIYPHVGDSDDEAPYVAVGDAFIILSRTEGWWIVQEDPTGTGIVDTSGNAKTGRVPDFCLLETRIPIATAIADAEAASTVEPGHDDGKSPILPLSFISPSSPGIALVDYRKQGEEEVDMAKGEFARVFKEYNDWYYTMYIVKEAGGHRGWVPTSSVKKTA